MFPGGFCTESLSVIHARNQCQIMQKKLVNKIYVICHFLVVSTQTTQKFRKDLKPPKAEKSTPASQQVNNKRCRLSKPVRMQTLVREVTLWNQLAKYAKRTD